MDNQYTRKEKECPLNNQFCDSEGKDCNRCIGEETRWQEKDGMLILDKAANIIKNLKES